MSTHPPTAAHHVSQLLGSPRLTSPGATLATAFQPQTTKTVLVAEHDRATAELIAEMLSGAGYQALIAENGKDALMQVRGRTIDAIVLDCQLQHRQLFVKSCGLLDSTRLPFLLVAPVEQTPYLLASPLLHAAHEFLSKPFLQQDLLVRLRRTIANQRLAATVEEETKHPSAADEFSLNKHRREVQIDLRRIKLTPNECRLLAILTRHAGTTVEKDSLICGVWAGRFFNDENVLRVTIRRLRAKIEHDPSHPQFVETIYGKGYRLNFPHRHRPVNTQPGLPADKT